MSMRISFFKNVFIFLSILFFTTLFACPKPATTIVESYQSVVTHSNNEFANARFLTAQSHYEAMQFETAEGAFRLFTAEFPDTLLALDAEFYLGRSLLANGQIEEGQQIFRSLMSDEQEDVQIAARLYFAFATALEGTNSDPQIAGLAEAHLPLRYIIAGDEALIAGLMAESRFQSSDRIGALQDLAAVFHHGDSMLIEFAILRADTIAQQTISRQTAQQWVDSSDPFISATGTLPLIEAMITAGEMEQAQALFVRQQNIMQEIGLLSAYALASARLINTGEITGLRYGALLSLSGPNRRASRAALGAILLAQRALEEETPRSTVLIRDTFDDPNTTIAAVRDLAAAGVSVIIGPIEPELAMIAQQEANLLGIPLISLSSIEPDTPIQNAFRIGLSAKREAQTVVEALLLRRECNTFVIAINASPSRFHQDFADEVQLAAQENRATIQGEIILEGDTSQLAAEHAAQQLSRIEACGLILATTGEEASALTAHLATQNIWPATENTTRSSGRRYIYLAGNSFTLSESITRNSTDYAAGILIPYWFDSTLATGSARAFTARFAHIFARDPGVIEMFAFDAAMLVRQYLFAGAHSPTQMLQHLNTSTFTGVHGELQFDQNGELSVMPSIAELVGNHFVTIR